MELFDNLKMYLRFALGLREYASQRITQDEARQIIQQRMASRETRFLQLVRRGIIEHGKSPYVQILKLAGCEYGDIEKMVKASGLENTLKELRQAGVYVSFEELKGRKPIDRNGKSIPVSTSDFQNPLLKVHLTAETGGTTGVGRRLPLELDHMAEMAPQLMLSRLAHGCLDSPMAIWRGPIPDSTGISHFMRSLKHDHIAVKWYTADLQGDAKPRFAYRLSTWLIIQALRTYGVPVPKPEPLPLERAIELARWAEKTLKSHGSCFITAQAGRTLRVCLAAQKAGIDLTGAVFYVTGEPITKAKVKVITDSGARYYPQYAMFEFGPMAVGCVNPQCSDDLHFIKDCYALITHPHTLPGHDVTVNALNITSLLHTAPLLLINAQIDDYGVVEERTCGCDLEKLGYTQHLSKIASYSKLVAGGVHLVGSDLLKIVEEALPAKFGGSPLDYQLLEQEDEEGISRVNLLVSPQIELKDEQEIKSVFLDAIKNKSDSYTWAQSQWKQGETLQVVRRKPYSTARGKHLTLWRQRGK